ncbi:capsular biosynthesis protein [Lysinibacillus sp. 2017]|uniref:tyrosine-protein phosphatase n=1 Tax=unclassified Lysinibacillus TaxID=2636778 RepID=UPI000D5275AB|nr:MULTISPECIES: CpsB/CapC family capsule biosynthesis tyrosine phosphatase [unclassified Lysinibacillus]AWE06749.1 capsular biosynthesis protein [Lysinibacillus sp. 2017]TGN37319.1 capsular biosynthesis protein [Lysinibacillus sp. S2017]
MVDMHCHILWNEDDGPTSKAETMKLIEQAVKEGITTIISTSHSNHPLYDVEYNVVTNQVGILQNELINNNIPLTLYTGHEVRLSEKIIPLYQTKQIHTLANSQYLLLELPAYTVPNYTKHIIHALLMEGITPIIAHPERNKAIAEKPDRLVELIRQGALSQITAGSLIGHFGRAVQKLSLDLVKANLVHVYGSDAHNLLTRPFLFDEGLCYLEKKKELDTVDILLENNERIIQNKPFLIKEPEEMDTAKWWKIFS